MKGQKTKKQKKQENKITNQSEAVAHCAFGYEIKMMSLYLSN